MSPETPCQQTATQDGDTPDKDNNGDRRERLMALSNNMMKHADKLRNLGAAFDLEVGFGKGLGSGAGCTAVAPGGGNTSGSDTGGATVVPGGGNGLGSEAGGATVALGGGNGLGSGAGGTAAAHDGSDASAVHGDNNTEVPCVQSR